MEHLTILKRKENHPYGFPGQWDVVIVSDGGKEAEVVSSEPTKYPLIALQEMASMYDKLVGAQPKPKILCMKCNAKDAVILENGKYVCEGCMQPTQLLLEGKQS